MSVAKVIVPWLTESVSGIAALGVDVGQGDRVAVDRGEYAVLIDADVLCARDR